MHELNEKAKQAKDKKAALGPDVDLDTFTAALSGPPESLLPRIDQRIVLRPRRG